MQVQGLAIWMAGPAEGAVQSALRWRDGRCGAITASKSRVEWGEGGDVIRRSYKSGASTIGYLASVENGSRNGAIEERHRGESDEEAAGGDVNPRHLDLIKRDSMSVCCCYGGFVGRGSRKKVFFIGKRRAVPPVPLRLIRCRHAQNRKIKLGFRTRLASDGW
jgi:hypothetical protein